jgi:acyl-[acyl carrier protein]--UDP-N-acetylglucosamine O-acyltransferase
VGVAGHVTVEDWVDVSPFSGVHQFCRIGRHAFIGGYSVVKQDVMPYSLTSHKPESSVFGANSIGLERRGVERATIEALQTAFRLLTRAGSSIPRKPSSASAPRFPRARGRGTDRLHRRLRAGRRPAAANRCATV